MVGSIWGRWKDRSRRFLYIMGRYKDVIVYGGDNIYPDQVEEIIEQIGTVIEAAVVGVEDPVYGENLELM